jgi:hypothetical protein
LSSLNLPIDLLNACEASDSSLNIENLSDSSSPHPLSFLFANSFHT